MLHSYVLPATNHTLLTTLPRDEQQPISTDPLGWHQPMKQKIKQSFTLGTLLLMLLFVISLMPEQQPVQFGSMPKIAKSSNAKSSPAKPSIDKLTATANLTLARSKEVHNAGYTECTRNTLLQQTWKYPCVQGRHFLHALTHERSTLL